MLDVARRGVTRVVEFAVDRARATWTYRWWR
jgi:hypothetical protein